MRRSRIKKSRMKIMRMSRRIRKSRRKRRRRRRRRKPVISIVQCADVDSGRLMT